MRSLFDLTVEKIIEIHDEVIARYDGAGGVLQEATLEYLVYRVNRIKDPLKRAALALHAIGTQHPFVDGNKRTALIVAENILGQDGYFIRADSDEVVSFMVAVASYRHTPGTIERWLKEHAEKMSKSDPA